MLNERLRKETKKRRIRDVIIGEQVNVKLTKLSTRLLMTSDGLAVNVRGTWSEESCILSHKVVKIRPDINVSSSDSMAFPQR